MGKNTRDGSNSFINKGASLGHSLLGLGVLDENRETPAKTTGGAGVEEWLVQIPDTGIKSIKGEEQSQKQRQNSGTWNGEIEI